MQRHFTATAFVIDSQNQVLLLWHKRLQRWMPPGGHVDPNGTPEDAARRECKEETNIDVEIIGDPSPNLFERNPQEGRMLKKPIAMLLENIPESAERKEPAHQHMDFLFLARPIDEMQIPKINHDESHEMKWFSQEEIQSLDEDTEIFSNVKEYALRAIGNCL